MKRLLKGLSQEGEAILNLIPGGVMQCRKDTGYTIVEVNDGFLICSDLHEKSWENSFKTSFLL